MKIFFFDATLYSTSLALLSSLFDEKKFTTPKMASIVTFWNLFMVPSGIIWSKMNEKLMNKLKIGGLGMTKAFFSKKYLMFDVCFNQFGYQLIFVPSFYLYFKTLFPTPPLSPSLPSSSPSSSSSPSLSSSSPSSSSATPFSLISFSSSSPYSFVKDLFIMRFKLSALSSVMDIWLTKNEGRNVNKLLKSKNMVVRVIWHLYVINKVDKLV